MQVKIKQLTGANVYDLERIGAADKMGKTYAAFHCSPEDAVKRVVEARDAYAATLSPSERRGLANSIGSVIRKLESRDASGGKHTIVTES